MKVKKYFLSFQGLEKEVTKEEWIKAERGAGFYSKFGSDHEATGGFSSGGISGSIRYEDPKSEPIFYRGKGEHSVNQLELIIHQLLEKEHHINAPYAEECIKRLNSLSDRHPNMVNQDHYDMDYVLGYFKAILKKDAL